MVKIKDITIANSGIYFGTSDSGDPTKEILSENSLKNLAFKYKIIPVTIDHQDALPIGYIDNLRYYGNILLGDLYIDDSDIDLLYGKYLSPEFILDKNKEPIAIVNISVVETPAITDNLEILPAIDNAKPYRAQKNRITKISGDNTCDFCKKMARKLRSNPVSWQKAVEMVPFHPNCKCEIKKV